ncbi:MFS transporter [Microbacterium sp. OVT16B]|uniref:MFS transporter n=1 Tax=Microbacterium sp. OVT16B TaxID=2862682 RepID=UPI001CBC4D85|nr:MFS transporter [Microbacterium sp. OVT16B]
MRDVEGERADGARGAGVGALVWLAVATFSMGIDGYVLAGLLPQIADDLSVGPAAAGQLMAVFALTSALAGPVLGALTGGWERKATIVGALGVFVIGNLVVALAPTYAIAMTGRVVSALGGALLNAVISAYVVAKTPPERRGRALSLILGGWLTATALGVPLGLLLGQSDWRIPLFLVVAVGSAALVGILLRVPRLRLPPRSLRETLQPLREPRLLAALVVPVGIMCASYLCFTYATLIVGPRVGGGLVMVLVMFCYGLLSLVGNVLTGRLTDRRPPVQVVTGILGLLIASALLGSLGLLLPGALGTVAAIVWFFACAVGNGGSGVPLQARLSAMAPDSAALVFALNGSAMALGSALGSGLGGAALEIGVAPDRLLLISAVVLAATMLVHLAVGPRSAASALRA